MPFTLTTEEGNYEVTIKEAIEGFVVEVKRQASSAKPVLTDIIKQYGGMLKGIVGDDLITNLKAQAEKKPDNGLKVEGLHVFTTLGDLTGFLKLIYDKEEKAAQ